MKNLKVAFREWLNDDSDEKSQALRTTLPNPIKVRIKVPEAGFYSISTPDWTYTTYLFEGDHIFEIDKVEQP